MFARKTFKNLQTFTYRKVEALRYRSTLTHTWKGGSRTTASVIYRDNSIGQNPAYRIKDDYRKQGSLYRGNKSLAHGEINESGFSSYAMVAQHKQNFKWRRTSVTGGLSADLSPSDYFASYIRIKKDTVTNKYISYQPTDSILTNYQTRLNNYAAFVNLEMSVTEKLRLTAAVRYDAFHYDFNNHLAPSSFSGSPDTVNHFRRLSPKLGFTYNFSHRTGVYANYSEGFVPPQVTEMYTGVKVPNLDASVFYNLEAGGWAEIIRNKLTVDLSIYRLRGTNEIISVKNDDGSFSNQNAGNTSHKGVEFGLNALPLKNITFRFSGAYSQHKFSSYVEKGIDYSGYEMNGAPAWIYNGEIWYKPACIKGLRLGLEMQHIGSYWTDPKNTTKYSGYDVFHIRIGYQLRGFEWWLNVMNVTNSYYATNVTKGSSGYSYTVADPRNINLGFSYDFGTLFKKK
jgi:outer membrane receptor protein involved in Fe transport